MQGARVGNGRALQVDAAFHGGDVLLCGLSSLGMQSSALVDGHVETNFPDFLGVLGIGLNLEQLPRLGGLGAVKFGV